MHSNVLVTAAGGIVAQGIIKSLRLANSAPGPVNYHILGVDMSPFSAGLYRCDEGLIVPPASSPEYIDGIIGACKAHRINAIFVGSDDELLVIAKAKKQIEKECQANLIVGDIKALITARDKWKCYQFCRNNGVRCPESALSDDCESFLAHHDYPVIIKPTSGYGSRDVYYAKSPEDASRAIDAIKAAGWEPMLQRYVPGDEFTSGVTIDKTGSYVMSSITIRKTIRHGQTYKAVIDSFDYLRRSAESVALKLGTNGPVNIQVRLDSDGTPLLIEINPRFSASCPMRATAGINEPDMVFRNEVLGEDLKVDTYDSLVCLRYWNEVYVPRRAFDKTCAKGHSTLSDSESFIPSYF